jgi:hypothetical protein
LGNLFPIHPQIAAETKRNTTSQQKYTAGERASQTYHGQRPALTSAANAATNAAATIVGNMRATTPVAISNDPITNPGLVTRGSTITSTLAQDSRTIPTG